MSNLGDSNRNNDSIDFSNGDDIAGKVDAFWREEYNIPYLTEMLERRQTLLTSMRVNSWESRIKPLELIYNRIERKNASLVLEREHIQMMIEDVVSRRSTIIENANIIHNNLKKRCNEALSKYYFIVNWSNRKTISKDTYAGQGGKDYVKMTKKNLSAERKIYADRGRGGYLKGSEAQVVRGSSDALQIQKRKAPSGYLPARVDNGIF
eukprot:g7802.t1